MIKKSPWIRYLNIKPERDAQRERDYWRYVKSGKVDELLMRISHFLSVRQVDRAASVLKQYLLALKTKRSAALQQALDTSTTNATQATAMADMFWKNVFELSAGDGLTDENENDGDTREKEEINGKLSNEMFICIHEYFHI